jgi:HAD superfamily hydrolase (TIGR01509 family)
VTELLPAAVFFDMDGTLVDTEPYWMRAEEELVTSFGGTWTHEDGFALIGSGLWHSAAVLRGRGVARTDDEIIEHLTSRVLEQVDVEVPWRPGARELLSDLKDAGIPTALVTMSLRRMADHFAAAFDFDAFTVVVGGDEVEHSKPHPAPYLRAAELLGVDPTHSIAIEDSTTGLASAVASGAISIGVPLHLALTEGLGYTIWPTLAGKSVADLAALYVERQRSAA